MEEGQSCAPCGLLFHTASFKCKFCHNGWCPVNGTMGPKPSNVVRSIRRSRQDNARNEANVTRICEDDAAIQCAITSLELMH